MLKSKRENMAHENITRSKVGSHTPGEYNASIQIGLTSCVCDSLVFWVQIAILPFVLFHKCVF